MSSNTAVTLDWLSYTLPWNSPRVKHLSPDVAIEAVIERASGVIETWYAERALHGYRWQYVSVEKPGLRVMISPRNHQMGIHVQFAGSALQGENVLERLEFALNAGGTITRIDIAVDVAQKWDIAALYELAESGGAITRTKKFALVTSTEGTTFYAGSRTSQKFLRIYDKQAQTKGSRPWTRIELECKAEFAQNIARFLFTQGLTRIPEIVRGFLDFSNVPAWALVMNSNIERVSLPNKERASNTRGWLLELVAPSLAKYIQRHPEFKSEFILRLDTLLEGTESGVGEAERG